MIDPFATPAPTDDIPPWEQVDNTPAQPAEISQEAPISTTGTNPLTVNVGNEGKLVATFKGGRDFDAPWLVVHATSAVELDSLLADWGTMGPLLDKVSKIGRAFAAEGSGKAAANSTSAAPRQAPAQGGGQPGRPAGASQSPDGVTLQCQHGDRVYRNKVEGGQMKWEAQFCPTPKGTADQCSPVFKDRKKGWG